MTAVPLRHVAEVRTSSVDKHAHEGEAPVQLCNYVDVYKNDKVGPGPHLMRATATSDEVSRFHLELGDSVLTKDSEDPKDIGISAYVDATADDFVCGYHLAIARPLDGTHPRYLTWALRSRPVLDHFTNHASGISRYGLTTVGLRAALVPWHELEKQRRIAHYLDDRVARIDQVISARRAQVALIESARIESVRELTDGDEEAQGWSRLRVAHVFRTGSGSTPPSDRLDYYDGGVPWVNTGDVRDGPLTETARTVTQDALADFSTLVRYPAGSLVVAMYGQGATKGRTALLKTSACVNQACCVLQGDSLLLQWAFHWFRAHKPYIVELANGAGQPNLSQEIIRNVRLTLPPSQKLGPLLKEIEAREALWAGAQEAAEQQIGLLQEYKQSLITAAVTGEIDVTTAGSGIPG